MALPQKATNVQINTRTVDEDFKRRKSTAGRVGRQRFNKKRPNRAANDNRYTSPQGLEGLSQAAEGITESIVTGTALKLMSPALFWISGIWSAFVAILGIMGFYIYFLSIKASFVDAVITYFTDVSLAEGGNGLVFTAMLLSFIGYLGFILFFAMLKHNPLSTMSGTGVTVVFLALDMIPLSQIFPWMLLWVFILVYTPGRRKRS